LQRLPELNGIALRENAYSIADDSIPDASFWNIAWSSGVWINVGITDLREEEEMVKVFAVLGLLLAASIAVSSADASEADEGTELTFSQSVQVPGKVLPAGTYWFVVADIGVDSEFNIVRIFSEDRSTLYATLQATSTEQLDIPYETEITFADRASMQPQVIVTWFYPGRPIGHEFRYPKEEEKEVAQARQYTVVAGKVFSNQLPREIAQTRQRTSNGN
jgi:hypothetical protein